MHEHNEQLEQALKGLNPRRPSALLRERIARKLERTDDSRVGHAASAHTHWYQRPWLQAAASFAILLAGLLAYLATSSQDQDTVLQAEALPTAEAESPRPGPAGRSPTDPVPVERFLARDKRPPLPAGEIAPSPVHLVPSELEPFRPGDNMDIHKRIQALLGESGLGHDHMMETMERLWSSFPGDWEGVPGSPWTDTSLPGFGRVDRDATPAAVFSAGDVTLTLSISSDRGRYLEARHRDGTMIFEGPVNTDDEIDALPANVAELLEELNQELETPGLVDEDLLPTD
jgi:hypothetical protein